MKRQAPKRKPEKAREWERRSRERARKRATERRSEALVAAPVDDWRSHDPKPGFRRNHPEVAKWLQGFKIRVFKLHGRVCLVHGCRRRAQHAHHVVPVRTILMREGEADGGPLVGDARNGIPLCEDCHERHENASRRVRRADLPPIAVQWAEDREWGWLIERFYPA